MYLQTYTAAYAREYSTSLTVMGCLFAFILIAVFVMALVVGCLLHMKCCYGNPVMYTVCIDFMRVLLSTNHANYIRLFRIVHWVFVCPQRIPRSTASPAGLVGMEARLFLQARRRNSTHARVCFEIVAFRQNMT